VHGINRQASWFNTQPNNPRYFGTAKVKTLLGEPTKNKERLR